MDITAVTFWISVGVALVVLSVLIIDAIQRRQK